MSTNTNTNAFGILNVQALNKAFNVIFNDQADAKFQTYVVDDYGKHEGGGTAIKSWQMKKYLSALTSALNNTYKVVEGRWLFLKVTEEFIRDQFPGFDCGYAIGGNEMREAVASGRIVRTLDIKDGEVYRLEWDGHRITTFHIEVTPFAEGEPEWASHNRNRYHHVNAIGLLALAHTKGVNLRFVFPERLEDAAKPVYDLLDSFNNGDGEALAAKRYERKRQNNERNMAARADDLANRLVAKSEGLEYPPYVQDGISVKAEGVLNSVGAKDLVGRIFTIEFKSGRPYQGGEAYIVDADNVLQLAALVKRSGLVLVERVTS